MPNLYPLARVLWSLSGSGLGTTLSADGNSGDWAGNGAGDIYPAVSGETPVDLRDCTDVMLMISVTDVTSSPSLKVSLDAYDELGNLYAGLLGQADAMTVSPLPATAMLSGGLHGGYDGVSGTTYLVLPRWGRVSWTLSGGTVTGTEIALLGR